MPITISLEGQIMQYHMPHQTHQSIACCRDVLSLHDDSTNLSLYILPHRHSMSGTRLSDISMACSTSNYKLQSVQLNTKLYFLHMISL